MDDLDVLQAVRLKGRVGQPALASTLRADQPSTATRVGALAQSGLLRTGETIKITPDGRGRLAALLAEERSGIDHGAMNSTYADFRTINRDFKVLVTDWQIRDGQPNTHADDDYDARILLRLAGIHDRVLPVIASAAAQLPRLATYEAKLTAALSMVSAGATMWFTRPLIDSYHTVWFELYEELLLAAGLTREQEAVAGFAH